MNTNETPSTRLPDGDATQKNVAEHLDYLVEEARQQHVEPSRHIMHIVAGNMDAGNMDSAYATTLLMEAVERLPAADPRTTGEPTNSRDARPARHNETENAVDRAVVTTYVHDARCKLENAANTCRGSSDTDLRKSTLPRIEKHLRDLTRMTQPAKAEAEDQPTRTHQTNEETTFEIRITPKVSDKIEDQLCTTLFKNAERWILNHLFQLAPYDPTPSVSKRSHGTTTDPTVLKVMFNHNFTTEETTELVSEITETVAENVTTRKHEINVTVQQLQTAAAQT